MKNKKQDKKDTREVASSKEVAVSPKNDLKKNNGKRPIKSVILVAVLDFVVLVVLGAILFGIPAKAEEVKRLKNISFSAKARSEVEIADLEVEQNKIQAEALDKVFPSEAGLVEFVAEVEKLEGEGTVVGFNFVNQKAVTDKNGGLGIPLLIELEGGWEDVSRDILIIEKMPFMFRPISIEAEPNPAGVRLQYGGFLYVNEKFQDR